MASYLPLDASSRRFNVANRVTGQNLKTSALTDLTAFADLIEFKGGWKNFYNCHKELADHITKSVLDPDARKSRLVLMPRGHFKSSICSVLYVLWRLYRNPNYRCLVVCNNRHLSYSFIRELRAYLENVELQETVWNSRPHIEGRLIPEIDKRNRTRSTNIDNDTDATDRKIVWTANALQMLRPGTFKEPSVYAASVGSPITGFHFDEAICDDVVDFVNVKPPRADSVRQWLEDLNSVLNPVTHYDFGSFKDELGQQELVVGTRYGLFDYYGQILEDEESDFDTLVRSIYVDDNVDNGYLCPELFNQKLELKLRRKMSDKHFSCQYLNKVYVNDFAVLQADNAKFFSSPNVFTDTDGKWWFRYPQTGKTVNIQPVIVIDPAFTNDDCCVLVGAKADGNVIVLDGEIKVMTPTDLIKVVKHFAAKYQTRRVYSEQNGVGTLLPSLFYPVTESNSVNGMAIVINQHWESRPKQEKIEGVLQPLFFNSQIYFNESFKLKACWRQLFEFPSSPKDDFLDGLVILTEKTINSKSTVDNSKNINIKDIVFDLSHLGQIKEEQTYIGQYSGYYA